jgi:GTP-binding protein EngB required for normal cell division
MTSTKNLSVFLCHTSTDKPAVRALCQELRRDGFNPWLDEEKLIAGQDWQYEITEAVRLTHVVLICLSNASISKAGFVQKEIKFALDIAEEQPEGAIFIIPLKLEECNVPSRLQRWQWVNYFESKNGPKELLQALNKRAEDLGILPAQSLKSAAQQILEKNIHPAFKYAFKDAKPSVSRKKEFVIGIIGKTGVGKTSLINSLTDGKYTFLSSITSGTLAIDLYDWFKNIRLANIPWYGGVDFRDQKHIYSFLRTNTDMVLFVIDSGTNRVDLETHNFFSALLEIKTPLLLIVNRIDYHLDNYEKVVFKTQFDQLEKEFGLPILPVSAHLGINIDAFREYLLAEILENNE